MNDGKADGPYRFEKIEQCERNEDVEEALFGPGADRCDYENADTDYLLNFGFIEGVSSRDAEVAALKAKVNSLEKGISFAMSKLIFPECGGKHGDIYSALQISLNTGGIYSKEAKP
ncbi:MAG: hypothetical protein M0R80_26095 [Proteobacteria bacterium]|jgi:hypothetical protein|nr:hypothetical protein [Pseudomonadota bacterium]